jgi:O-antigen ligase
MDTALYVNVIIIAIGLIILIISMIDYAIAFAIFLSIYPIIYTAPVIEGWSGYNPSRIIIFLLFIVSLFKIKPYWQEIPFKGIIYSYLLFLLMLLISVILSELPKETFTRSLIYLLPIMFYCCTLVAVISNKKGLRYIFGALIIGFTLTTVYGLLELIMQRNILIDLGIIVQEYDWMTDVRLGYGRIISFIGQPVFAALYYIFTIPVIFFIRKNYIQSTLAKQCLIIILIMAIICVLYTGSRTGLVGLALLIIIYFALSPQEFNISRLLTICLMMIGFIYFIAPEGFFTYSVASFEIHKPVTEETQNFLGRFEVTYAMLDIARENLLFGFGPGYLLKMKDAYGVFLEIFGMENQYAALVADAGIFGLVTFLIFLITIFKASGKIRYSKNDFVKGWAIIFISILWVLVTTGFTYMYIVAIIFDFLMVYLGVQIGLAYIESKEHLYGN